MTQKICFDCFHKLFPDKPIRKVTLGRQCVVADTIHVVIGPAVLQDCRRIATQVGRSVEDIAKEAIMARFAELGAVGAAAVDSPRRWLPARPSCSGGVGGTRRVCRSWSSFRVEGLLDSPLRIPDKVLQD